MADREGCTITVRKGRQHVVTYHAAQVITEQHEDHVSIIGLPEGVTTIRGPNEEERKWLRMRNIAQAAAMKKARVTNPDWSRSEQRQAADNIFKNLLREELLATMAKLAGQDEATFMESFYKRLRERIGK